jgi:hypothetical protein
MRANGSGSSGESNLIQIRSSQSGLPNSQVLDQVILPESSLGFGFATKEFVFTQVPMVSPQTALALVVRPMGSGDKTADLEYKDALLGLIGKGTMATSGGSDYSWWSGGDSNLLCQIYGKVTTADPAATGYLLTDVRVTLRSGRDSLSRLAATVRTSNEPQVTGP